MSRWKVTARLVLAIGLLLALGLVAEAQDCHSVCTPTTSCSQACYIDAANARVNMTCGSGSWPCARPTTPPTPPPTPPPCKPNWQVVSAQLTGQIAKTEGAGCTEYSSYYVHWHDANGCYPNSNSCENVPIHFHAPGNCCIDVLCYGSECR
jgi:hypothetical protein